MSLAATVVNFQTSAFVPLALGFFGLGTGYLIYGPQELAGYPQRDRRVDISTGIWGILMPGFLQFVTGILLFVGLTWFSSFTDKPLYMAAVAFTAYGVHWWALGLSRTLGGDPRPNAFMAIPFLVLSVVGAVVFFGAHDNPVGALFVGYAQPAWHRSAPESSRSRAEPTPSRTSPGSGHKIALCRPFPKPTVGFEPTTPALRERCSGQLSYVGGPGQSSFALTRPGSRSQKAKPSRITLSPSSTGIGSEKIGPACTKVWNSPFSPQGSPPSGRSASSCASNERPTNDGSSCDGSPDTSTASNPESMKSRASSPVSRPHTGNSARLPASASRSSR